MTPSSLAGPIIIAAGGLALGALGGGVLMAWLGRRRLEARSLRWESKFHALEAELAGTRIDQARIRAERSALETDLSVLNDTLAALRGEVDAHRRALDETGRDRDLARRRADAAVDELVHTRLQLVDAQAGQADHEARLRELKLLIDQRSSLAGRLEQTAKARAEAEAERTRLTVMVQSLEGQLRQSVEAARHDRERADATRAAVAAQVLDRQRRLDEARTTIDRLEAEAAELRSQVGAATAAVADAETRLRTADLARQEEIARLEAQRGSLLAQVERLDPLRRQVADREELLRSLARERDEAAAALVRRERELRAELERVTGLLADATARARRLDEREVRLAEVEARLAAVLKERDQLQIAERTAQGRIAALSGELKDRDNRFRTLLDDRRTVVEAAQIEIARLREEIDRLRVPSFSEPDPVGVGPGESSDGVDHGFGNGAGNGGGPALLAAPAAFRIGPDTAPAPLRLDPDPAPVPLRSDPDPGALPRQDDLKRISGIGPALEQALRNRGVHTFRQIAQWTDADIDRFGAELGSFRKRIRRDRWVEQARREHHLAYGEALDG
ncbi:MAG: hypothetical protein JNJ80_09440 [Gemmatimonadetes bacterium]|nr:hypothetical protein [Gemmatimonadota bacterium]